MSLDKETYNRLKLGLFVTTGLVLLITGMYFIGSNKNLFGHTFRLYATFYNINGLQRGNNVRCSGIDVGTVGKIEIQNDTSLHVEMLIDVNLKSIIHKNSVASIGTDGLMGNKLINIEPGDPDDPGFDLVKEGDELKTLRNVDTDKMLRTLEFTNQNVSLISEDLKNITGNLNQRKGTLYALLLDTSLAASLHRSLENIELMSSNLKGITSDVSSMVNGVKEGQGLIGSVLTDSSQVSKDFNQTLKNLETASHQFSELSAELKTTVNKLNNGNGTFSTLLTDSVFSAHLKRSMISIDSSAYNFNENMKALQGNIFFRKYFRQQKKEKQK